MKDVKYSINLIKELAWADFKLKYYGSVLGLFWTFLKPLLMLLILYMVFTHFVNVGIPDFQIYLLLGIVFWNFFADATRDSMSSIKSKSQIIRNTRVSGVIIVLSTCLHSTLTFFVNLLVFFLVFFASGFSLSLSAVVLIYLLLLQIVLVSGISLFVSVLNMKFTDFSHMWDVFLQMLFWSTPIVYSENFVPKSYVKFFLLNPLARIIIDARNTVVYHFFPEPKQLFITTVIIILLFSLGIYVFRKYYRMMVDNI